MSKHHTLTYQFSRVARHVRAGSAQTRQSYWQSAQRFIKHSKENFAIKNLNNLAEKHVVSYLASMRSSGKSGAYMQKELSAMRYWSDNGALGGRNQDWIPDNADLKAADLLITKARATDRAAGDKYIAMREHLPADVRDATDVIRGAGLRVEEVATLRKGNITENGISFRDKYCNTKGARPREISFEQMGPRAEAILKARSAVATAKNQRLFHPDLSARSAKEAIREAMRQASVTANVTGTSPHSLRYDAAQKIFSNALKEQGIKEDWKEVHQLYRDGKLSPEVMEKVDSAYQETREFLGHGAQRTDVTDRYLGAGS